MAPDVRHRPARLPDPFDLRAATVLLRLHRSPIDVDHDQRLARAIGLLNRARIVVSMICGPTGAGSRLVTVDLLERISDRSIGFGRWMLWGLPDHDLPDRSPVPRRQDVGAADGLALR